MHEVFELRNKAFAIAKQELIAQKDTSELQSYIREYKRRYEHMRYKNNLYKQIFALPNTIEAILTAKGFSAADISKLEESLKYNSSVQPDDDHLYTLNNIFNNSYVMEETLWDTAKKLYDLAIEYRVVKFRLRDLFDESKALMVVCRYYSKVISSDAFGAARKLLAERLKDTQDKIVDILGVFTVFPKLKETPLTIEDFIGISALSEYTYEDFIDIDRADKWSNIMDEIHTLIEDMNTKEDDGSDAIPD